MKRVYIIAEAGVNHNGDIGIAKKLIEAAAKAGADAVKFQTFKSENLVTKSAPKAGYQKAVTDSDESQMSMLKNLELRHEDYPELMAHSRKHNITFLSTPFDSESLHFLNSLDLELMKVASGEITNLPFLREIGRSNKRVILSTGMSRLGEVEAAVDVLRICGVEELVVLHCNTEYPTPFDDVNLNAMRTIKEALQVEVGYSDHTQGIEVSIAAVALGATVIEKHFTLDQTMPGPDHQASLNPQEFQAMTAAIRNIEKALGTGKKEPSPSEKENMKIARKSIVAKRKILIGEQLTPENLAVKRPGNGLSPMLWDEIIGLKACDDFEEDELIRL